MTEGMRTTVLLIAALLAGILLFALVSTILKRLLV